MDKMTELGGSIRARTPLYSRKLHMRVRRDSTSWVTSLIILAFSLGERVVNHLARRCQEKSRKVSRGELQDRGHKSGGGRGRTTLPWRERRIR